MCIVVSLSLHREDVFRHHLQNKEIGTERDSGCEQETIINNRVMNG